MPGEMVQLLCYVTKEAADLVAKGDLVFSSGGVRRHDGTLYEQAKPAIMIGDNTITTPTPLVSDLVDDHTPPYLGDTLKALSRNTDLSLKKLQNIEKCLTSIAGINALSWANCALSIANCGISVAGFAMVLQQMNRLSGQVKALSEMVDQAIRSDLMERFDRYCLNLQSCLHSLELGDFDAAYSLTLEDHLNEAAAFMNRLIRDIQRYCAYTDLAVSMLFGLATPFAHAAREYSVKYRYARQSEPANLPSWISVLAQLIDWDFTKALKRHMLYAHLELTMEQRYAAYSGGYTAAQLQLGNLAFSQALTKALPEKTYVALDEILAGSLDAGKYIVQGDRVGIPITQIQS